MGGFTEVEQKRADAGRRIAGIVQGAFTAVANRAVSSVISFVSVPLTLNYLGTERYGIWVLLSSILAWLRLADVGIGNGLVNAIAGAVGIRRYDLVRIYISTAVVLLWIIAVLLCLLIVVLWPLINWELLLGAQGEIGRSEIAPAIQASITFFLLSFPASIVIPAYNALQQGRLANFWSIGASLIGFFALLGVIMARGSLVSLVVAVSGANLLVTFASAVWLFHFREPSYAPAFSAIQAKAVPQLLKVGIPFFLVQIMALVVFQTDNLLVAHYLGASMVPTYSVTYNLFAYTSIPQSALFSYIWVAYSDAIARGDVRWVRRVYRFNMLGSVLFAGIVLIPLVLVAQSFIRFWTSGAVDPPFDLIVWMAAWSMINAICSPVAALLAASSQMRAQLVYGALAMSANIGLSIVLLQIWGIKGAIAGSVISYAIFVVVPTIIDGEFVLVRLLRRSGSSLTGVGPLPVCEPDKRP